MEFKSAGAYLALVLISIEIGLRLVIAGPVTYLRPAQDPELLYELMPGAHRSTGTLFKIKEFSVSVSEAGCRLPQPDAVVDPSPDIVFLGDSFTFGQGVNDGETYVSRLGELLPPLLDRPIHVQNCAGDGYNLSQIARSVEVGSETMSPQLLVVSFFANDLEAPMPLHELTPKFGVVRHFVQWFRSFRLAYLLGVMTPWKGVEILSESDIRGALDRMAEPSPHIYA